MDKETIFKTFYHIRQLLKEDGGIKDIQLDFPILEIEEHGEHLGLTDMETLDGWQVASSGMKVCSNFKVRKIKVRVQEDDDEEKKFYSLQTLVFVFLHELAHSISPPEMRKGKILQDSSHSSRKWQHHDHNQSFYENFTKILKASDLLEILHVKQCLGKFNFDTVKRLDNFEVRALDTHTKLGRNIETFYHSTSTLEPNLPFIHSFRVLVTHHLKGKKILMIPSQDLTFKKLLKLIENKFQCKILKLSVNAIELSETNLFSIFVIPQIDVTIN